MEKRKNQVIVALVFLVLILGFVFIYATKKSPDIEKMKKVGQIFNSSEDKADESIYARGKSGGVISNDEIKEATEFYVLAGYDRVEAKEKAIQYMLKRDATYQKAISEGYIVTDDEIYAYLDQLKTTINEATNSDEAKALIEQFDSEDEYWQHEFEVYKVNLPIEKYLEAVKKEYIGNNSSGQSGVQDTTGSMEGYNDYIEELQKKLVEQEQYEITE